MELMKTVTGKIVKALFPLALVTVLVSCENERRADPDTLVRDGWYNYRLGEYSIAMKKFGDAIAGSEKGSDIHLKGLYGMAVTLANKTPEPDKSGAEALFLEIIRESPKHDLAAWSMLATARMRHLARPGEQVNYSDLEKRYKEVTDKFPFHPAGEEAYIYMQSARFSSLEDSKRRKIIEDLEAFIARHPNSGFKSCAHMILSRCYELEDIPGKSLDSLIECLEAQELDSFAPAKDKSWFYWTIASKAEFKCGDFETARKYYKRLIDEYPVDMRIYGAEQALERMNRLEERLKNELTAPQKQDGQKGDK
jgi:tetratricopeptide (TPR) repeat protein